MSKNLEEIEIENEKIEDEVEEEFEEEEYIDIICEEGYIDYDSFPSIEDFREEVEKFGDYLFYNRIIYEYEVDQNIVYFHILSEVNENLKREVEKYNYGEFDEVRKAVIFEFNFM